MDVLVYDGKEYELPKKTLRVEKMIDDVYKADTGTREQSAKVMYNFVREILGAENATKVLESDNINDVDTQTLIIVFKSIEDAYLARVMEFQRQQQYDKLSQPAFDKLETVGKSVANIVPLMNATK